MPREVGDQLPAIAVRDGVAQPDTQPIQVRRMHQHLDIPLAGQLSNAADVVRVSVRADDADQVVQGAPDPLDMALDPPGRTDQASVDQRQLRLVDEKGVDAQQPDGVDAGGDLHGRP